MHILALVLHPHIPRVFAISITTAIFTSIWNHGFTSEIAKWLDRITIGFAAIIDMYYLATYWYSSYAALCLGISWSAIGMYFMAKHTGNDLFHVLSHAIQTACHLIMIGYIWDS